MVQESTSWMSNKASGRRAQEASAGCDPWTWPIATGHRTTWTESTRLLRQSATCSFELCTSQGLHSRCCDKWSCWFRRVRSRSYPLFCCLCVRVSDALTIRKCRQERPWWYVQMCKTVQHAATHCMQTRMVGPGSTPVCNTVQHVQHSVTCCIQKRTVGPGSTLTIQDPSWLLGHWEMGQTQSKPRLRVVERRLSGVEPSLSTV